VIAIHPPWQVWKKALCLSAESLGELRGPPTVEQKWSLPLLIIVIFSRSPWLNVILSAVMFTLLAPLKIDISGDSEGFECWTHSRKCDRRLYIYACHWRGTNKKFFFSRRHKYKRKLPHCMECETGSAGSLPKFAILFLKIQCVKTLCQTPDTLGMITIQYLTKVQHVFRDSNCGRKSSPRRLVFVKSCNWQHGGNWFGKLLIN